MKAEVRRGEQKRAFYCRGCAFTRGSKKISRRSDIFEAKKIFHQFPAAVGLRPQVLI